VRLRNAEEMYLISIGVTPAFAERVMRTEPNQMWYPTHEELREGGIVTEITAGDDLALSGMGAAPDHQTIRAAFRNLRLYRVLETKEPDSYERVIQMATEAFREGLSLNELRAMSAPVLDPLFMKRLASADDAAVLRFARLLVAQLDALRAAPGSVCFDYAMDRDPDAIGKALNYIPAALANEELETIADVLESGGNGGKKTTEARTRQLMDRVLERIGRHQPEYVEVLEAIDGPGVDPVQGCHALRALYAGILSLPRRDSIPLLRSVFALEEEGQ
jgi:hypothetical protein